MVHRSRPPPGFKLCSIFVNQISGKKWREVIPGMSRACYRIVPRLVGNVDADLHQHGAAVADLAQNLRVLLVVDLSGVAGQQEAELLRRPHAVLHVDESSAARDWLNGLAQTQAEH